MESEINIYNDNTFVNESYLFTQISLDLYDKRRENRLYILLDHHLNNGQIVQYFDNL